MRRAFGPRGYTLVELMLASVGAMAVAVAVVGLSRMSETTMQDESRIARADADLRDLASVMRNDFARAGYMSSPWARTGRDNWFVASFTDTGTLPALGTAGTRPPRGVVAGSACVNPIHAQYAGGYTNVVSAAATDDVPYCTMANFDRLAAVRLFQAGSIAGSSALSMANAMRPDAVILSANYATADDYPVRGVDSTVTPPLLAVDFGSAAGSRLFLKRDGTVDTTRFATAQSMASALFLDEGVGSTATTATAKTGMYRVLDDQGFTQFQYSDQSMSVDTSVSTAPAIRFPPSQNSGVFARGSASASGGLSGALIAVNGAFNPVNSFLYQVEPDPSPGAPGNSFALTKRALRPDGSIAAAGGTSTFYPIVLARNVVNFQVAFRVADHPLRALGAVMGACPTSGNVVIRDLDFSTTGVTAANDNRAFGNANGPDGDCRGPHLIVGVRFMLAVRADQADRTDPLVAANSPTASRYCMTQGLDAMAPSSECVAGSPFARVRTVVMEATLNGAGRFLR